ncbi:hypothetical protein FRUB_04243 [Fimbriiglobus ruber]|uniref:Uncharacterized protein n=1 Tax=Fimbriiglobus ruber TaxID=1908690 RepID=A0A225E0G5_9BACT|nr:hypothetical protein FRUB_04243 [Fimbriiglobus ruber]
MWQSKLTEKPFESVFTSPATTSHPEPSNPVSNRLNSSVLRNGCITKEEGQKGEFQSRLVP